MSVVTRRSEQKPALRVAESGWAKARHLPRGSVRTRIAAVADENASPAAHTSGDWNIVRGDD
ncbi:hypothetical protein GCM10010260_59520 [Streptomyces filipinensis]|uniref:Uncharacterized protein n=1 Tax=Streptomyces filipinensis TaxID=66887 RepID=A0A918IGA2_9ACTN|nr:hypothetical protein GCM10010260_59520 [Streptomyces filipinensis]